ncbi:MAG: hypothetical protein ACRELA_20170 [Candidatus Rokuibacteriota bacterium]
MPDQDPSNQDPCHSEPWAFPPAVDVGRWEDSPVFRETFLVKIARAELNAAFRAFADALYQIVLEAAGTAILPDLPGEGTHHDLAAVAADLRHLQGFLGLVGELCEGCEGEERRGKFALRVAGRLASIATTIEQGLKP